MAKKENGVEPQETPDKRKTLLNEINETEAQLSEARTLLTQIDQEETLDKTKAPVETEARDQEWFKKNYWKIGLVIAGSIVGAQVIIELIKNDSTLFEGKVDKSTLEPKAAEVLPRAEEPKKSTPATDQVQEFLSQCQDGEVIINHYAPLDGVLDRTVIGENNKSGIYALSWPGEELAILVIPPIREDHRINIKEGARSIFGIAYCDQSVTPELKNEAVVSYPQDLAESAVDEQGNMPTPVEDVGVFSLNPFTGELTEIKPGISVSGEELAQRIDAEEVNGGALPIKIVK